ncbi:hypothetical protein CRUP_015448 [Coryphaenoides rupestris]|nr:hypothetical protein CRUP_015448 [Coryphaenoides rupestris]
MAQTNPMNTMPMGPWKITVYDQEYFQGKRMEFTSCCQNIMEWGMENIRSLKGDYPRFEAYSGSNSYRIERMISFRPICCAFELCNDYPSLQAMGWFCNEVGSMHVQCGAFVCYQYPGYRGHQYIMECECHGGEYKCYSQFGSHAQTPQIQSIRRIQH